MCEGPISPPDARPPEAGTSSPGLLVVDDSPEVAHLFSYLLKMAGFQVWVAGDGKEALEVHRQHQDRIHAALFDVMMPGMDGPQAVQALLSERPGLPVLFVSGDIGRYTLDDLLVHGGRGLLQKPVTAPVLINAMRELVANSTEACTCCAIAEGHRAP